MPGTTQDRHQRREAWRDSIAAYGRPIMVAMLVLGFASGLPLFMVFQKLSFWLRQVGIDLTTIGFLYWVTLLYALKPLWSPVVDRVPLPILTRALGKRRSCVL